MEMKSPILLVDDDASIRKLCLRMLSRLEIEADTCSNGKEALEQMQNGKTYPAVLLDVNLPDLPGSVLMQELIKLQPDIRIIFFTGGPATPAATPESLYLKKPFTPATLKEVLVEAGVIPA
jgi:two-component system cell cycle sensor histidine kinase/response regulator CckA